MHGPVTRKLVNESHSKLIRFCINFFSVYLFISGLQIRVRTGKLIFLFLNQNICCGYSMRRSFEHPKHMFKLMGKEINSILGAQTILIWNYAYVKYI